MNSPDIHAFSRALGSLEASVENVTHTVANMTVAWAEQERNATEGRRELHDKIDDVRQVAFALASKVDGMAKEMIEISPAVREFRRQRERAIGARNLGRWVWGAMLTAAGGLGWVISEWLHYPRPH
jgi:hypothetical protein